MNHRWGVAEWCIMFFVTQGCFWLGFWRGVEEYKPESVAAPGCAAVARYWR